MRPQQQNRRMRGRGNNNNNNNNRKGPNPLTRSYESNGPDVKIRGTAQQVAEKYSTLARDAQSSGDRVMAENYLQHAEHYNRIIATAQAAQLAQQQQQQRDSQDDSDDDSDSGNDDRFDRDRNQTVESRGQHANGSGPQPVIEGVPAEVAHSQDKVARTGGGEPKSGGDAAAENSRHLNGQTDAGANEGAPPPKRARRPRKPRGVDAQADTSQANKGEAAPPETVN